MLPDKKVGRVRSLPALPPMPRSLGDGGILLLVLVLENPDCEGKDEDEDDGKFS
jgi:hypothetical protein